jgi:hypothetical protein
MRNIVLLGLLLVTTACEPYDEAEATFAAYNTSSQYTVQAVVNGAAVGDIIPPGQPTNFTVTVRVPRETNRAIGPDYRETEVTVAFQNLNTGSMTPPDRCDAGEGMTTSITYSVNSRGDEKVSCHNPRF